MDKAPRAPIDELMDWLAADPTFVERPGDPDEVTITFVRRSGRRAVAGDSQPETSVDDQ